MSAVFWIICAVVVLLLLAGGGKKNTAQKGPYRTYRPHVISPDDYECSVCHRRFEKDVTACPYCGARFTGTVTDEDEFTDEEEEQEAWDEEDGI